jgi:hypothetical protein
MRPIDVLGGRAPAMSPGRQTERFLVEGPGDAIDGSSALWQKLAPGPAYAATGHLRADQDGLGLADAGSARKKGLLEQHASRENRQSNGLIAQSVELRTFNP